MIRTDRLHIIPLNYYELISSVYSHTGMVQTWEDEDNVVNYSIKPMKDEDERGQLFYTVWVGEHNGVEVLECGYLCPPTIHNVVEVFCYTRPEYQKQGYGTEAVKGLVRFAEAFDDIKFVCASVDKDNKPSQKMFYKNGFYYLADTPKGMMVFNKQIKN